MVGAHVAVEKEQAGPACGGRQPVASDGAAFVGGQGDQAEGEGAGVCLSDQTTGQVCVIGAVVQQDQFDGAAQCGGFPVEQGYQRHGIVAQEGDQHR